MSSRPEVTWVNGAPADTVCALDRGLHYGDGLFETIACRGGRPRFVALHLERLALGCERLSVATPDLASLRAEIEALARGADNSIVKLVVTRGEALARGYAPAGTEVATRIAFRYAWPADEGLARVRTGQMRLGENPALAGLKHLSRLEQVLARAELRGTNESELLLFSSSGSLVSGTMSNVFIAHDGRLATPRLDSCGVAGVMRRVVMREASKAGIAIDERAIDAREVAGATEVFLTNVRIGVQPVAALDGRMLAVGELTQRLQALVAQAEDG